MRKPPVLIGMSLFCLAVFLCSAGPAFAQQGSGADGGQTISFHFADEVDLRVLAEWVSQVTGRAFVYDETFQGTVVLQVPGEIPREALMPLFETILKMRGFALVPRDDVTLIVQRQRARTLQTAMEWASDPEVPSGDEFVNQVVSLRFADAESVAGAIGHFLSSTDAVLPLPKVHQLAISDYADNVRRAVEMVRKLDTRAARPRVSLLPLENAHAEDVVGQLNQAFARERGEDAGGALPAPQFAADRRTNAVFVVAAEEDLQAVRETVEALDIASVGPERPVRIYRLRNTKAEDVIGILSDLIQDMEKVEAAPRGEGESDGPFGGNGTDRAGIKVVNDEKNNALVVAATGSEHEWLKELIDDLDRRRPQVLLETWLVVLNERGARQLGVELAARASTGDTEAEVGTFFGLSELDDTGRRILPPPIGEGAMVAILRPEDIVAILRALEEEQHGRIISRPRLLANDNELATFNSVRQEPFTTVSAITTTTSTTAFGGYEQAGTSLEILPTIYEDDYLFLDIGLAISNFTGEAIDANVPPPREENRIETAVTVPDGATIIIGGIVQTQERQAVSRVPILGSIPVLGALFRSTSINTTENTLYAFIRPRIFRAQDFSDLRGASAAAEQRARRLSGDAPEAEE